MRHSLLRSALTPLAFMALCLSGCGGVFQPQIIGSGKAATEKREVAPFTKIQGGGAIHVEATVGEPQSLEVTTDDNLVPHILTEVDNGVLTIRSDVSSYRTNLKVKVKATVKELTGMNLSGASHGKAAGITGAAFAADVSGASKIDAAGAVESLTADGSGASHVNALDLVAQKVTAKASGASHIEITAKESLDAHAHGASSIRFAGAPKAVTTTNTGASSVKAK